MHLTDDVPAALPRGNHRPRRLPWLLVLWLASGCGGPAPGTAPAGSDVLAQRRAAVRDAPDDAALRLLLADAELAADQASAAEASLRRAESLGAERSATLALLAEALERQRRVDSVLALTDAEATEAPGFELAFLRASVQLGLRNVDAKALRREWVGVLRLADALPDASPPTPQQARLLARLATLRESDAVIGAALQHYVCDRAPEAAGHLPSAVDAGRRVLEVGPTRSLRRPSDAARVAADGDVVEIDAGVYRGDVAVWSQNGLLLRGRDGMAILDSGGQVAEDAAIWVIRGNDVVVERVEFSGARASSGNGAGIRFLGRNLVIRGSVFRENQNGLLTWHDPDSEVTVEHSRFERNGNDDGLTHNIYVGRQRAFTLRYSHSHDARGGQAVKSRAARTVIAANRIGDEDDAASNYLVDLPLGGTATVVGNEFYRGARALNRAVISLAGEAKGQATTRQYVLHNTLHNRLLNAVFVRNHGATPALIVGNVLTGAPISLVQGPAEMRGNHNGPDAGLVDSARYDFRLQPDSPLIDTAEPLGHIDELDLAPQFEYAHPTAGRPRATIGPPDAGAHEFCGW